MRIVCLACPTTALNFLIITVFQATGQRVQPLILSLLRKGGLDIPLMLVQNRFIGVDGIAWATPPGRWPGAGGCRPAGDPLPEENELPEHG